MSFGVHEIGEACKQHAGHMEEPLFFDVRASGCVRGHDRSGNAVQACRPACWADKERNALPEMHNHANIHGMVSYISNRAGYQGFQVPPTAVICQRSRATRKLGISGAKMITAWQLDQHAYRWQLSLQLQLLLQEVAPCTR